MIHSVKISSEHCGFVSAGSSTDFHNCIAIFIVVRRQQRDLNAAFKIGDALFELRNLIVSHRRDLYIA